MTKICIQSNRIKYGVYFHLFIDWHVLIINKSRLLQLSTMVDTAIIHLEPVGLLWRWPLLWIEGAWFVFDKDVPVDQEVKANSILNSVGLLCIIESLYRSKGMWHMLFFILYPAFFHEIEISRWIHVDLARKTESAYEFNNEVISYYFVYYRWLYLPTKLITGRECKMSI